MSQPNGAAEPAGAGASWVRWRLVALLLAFSFMTWFNRVSMPVAYDDQIRAQFTTTEDGEVRYGIDEIRIGWVYTSLFILYTVFMTPGGWLVDRYGPRFALILMGFGS